MLLSKSSVLVAECSITIFRIENYNISRNLFTAEPVDSRHNKFFSFSEYQENTINFHISQPEDSFNT